MSVMSIAVPGTVIDELISIAPDVPRDAQLIGVAPESVDAEFELFDTLLPCSWWIMC